MTRSVVFLFLLASATAVVGGRADAQVTSKNVREAIARGIEYLRARQQPSGEWTQGAGRCGMTALATFALLTAGVPADDPAVRAGLGVLTGVPPARAGHTYDVSLQAMAYGAADPVAYRRQIQECAKWLLAAEGSKRRGVWNYGPRRGGYDHSNTQFAVMGLDAAALAGIKVPNEVWKRIADHYRQAQNRDGGWGYHEHTSSYGSMTAAGLASLILAGEVYGTRRLRGLNRQTGAACCGEYLRSPAIADALDWMTDHFSVDQNPGKTRTYYYYYLYALERVGMLAGQRRIGPHDWYALGAQRLLATQNAQGGWGQQTHETCFALLFLAKGRKSVLFSKLAWPGKWNVDRHGLEKLCGFIEKEANVHVAWQVVDVDDPIEKWMSAPILYFQGAEFPSFNADHKRKLAEFVERGGTILAEACCGKKRFVTGFHRFVQEVFPERAGGPLDPAHAVFRSFFQIERRFELEGIDVGCRTAIFLAPKDLSCLWEQANIRTWSEAAFQLGTNLAMYVVGEDPLGDRLEQAELAAAHAKPGPAAEGALQVAQLVYEGGWSPLPLALSRLAEELRSQAGVTVVPKPAIVEITDDDLLNHPICYMTGQDGFELTEPQRAALKRYLGRGGTLIADPCCGTSAFDESFRKMVEQMYGPRALAPVPQDHPILNGSVGRPLRTVRYRRAVADDTPDLDTVRLEAARDGDRLAIIYSPYNFSCGFDGSCGPGCRGLAGKDAITLGVNLLLFALQQ